MEKQAVDRPRCHSSVKDTSLNPDYKPNASLPQVLPGICHMPA